MNMKQNKKKKEKKKPPFDTAELNSGLKTTSKRKKDISTPVINPIAPFASLISSILVPYIHK